MTVGYEKRKESNAKYRERNLEEIREKDRLKKRERYKNDEAYKLDKQAKARARQAKIRQDKIDAGIDIKPRGRPRKAYGGMKTLDEIIGTDKPAKQPEVKDEVEESEGDEAPPTPTPTPIRKSKELPFGAV